MPPALLRIRVLVRLDLLNGRMTHFETALSLTLQSSASFDWLSFFSFRASLI